MKTFKQLLEEIQNIKWKSKTIDYVVKGFIPLTPKMMKRLFGSQEKIKALHITNWDNFKNLEKLQGSKKSISVGTNFDMYNYATGVQAGGGIVSVVEGSPLVVAGDDIWTQPDEAGRRWIDPGFSLPMILDPTDFVIGDYIIRDIYEFREKTFPKYTKNYDPDESYDSYYNPLNDLNNKDKKKLIKEYINFVEKLLNKHKKAIKSGFYQKVPERSSSWTEQVINEFKIVKVYLMKDHSRLGYDAPMSISFAGESYRNAGYDKKYPTKIISFEKFNEKDALK